MKDQKNHNLFYGSSYDRGLDILLNMWPAIRKAVPDAQLHIAYGWDLFLVGYRDNPERMAWKDMIDKAMKQHGIKHYGRLGKVKLSKLREKCGIWAYPTYFAEINCITALESQAAGLVPVTMNSFALKETVGSGVKIDGDIYDLKTQKEYIKALLEMMTNTAKWQEESAKAVEFAKNYSWETIADKWLNQL